MQITCKAEIRAAGLLVATNRARHTSRIAGFHDAVRFAEREGIAEYHPALAINSTMQEDDEPSADDKRVAAALSETVGLFVSAGWDAVLVIDCVEHVAYRLGDLGSRATAVESLRRDRAVPVLLGVPSRSWGVLLRVMLGHPEPKHQGTPIGDGVRLRLLSGEPLESLSEDAALGKMIRAAAPSRKLAA
ncbi:hypothetical protein [Microbacterium sp.]|uniref:hypothetical protein n=1 Tax=Microbacterium sp. TaxID=51671 RepID=UPI0039E21798